MVNLITISHGPLAKAILESAAMFFGEETENITAMGLYPGEDPEEMKERVRTAIEEKDDGDGVLILADLFGGSPFNMAGMAMAESGDAHRVECLSGMNLPMLMLALENRDSIGLDELTEYLEKEAPAMIVNLRKHLHI